MGKYYVQSANARALIIAEHPEIAADRFLENLIQKNTINIGPGHLICQIPENDLGKIITVSESGFYPTREDLKISEDKDLTSKDVQKFLKDANFDSIEFVNSHSSDKILSTDETKFLLKNMFMRHGIRLVFAKAEDNIENNMKDSNGNEDGYQGSAD